MHSAKLWFGVLAVSFPFAFVGCGDDAEDDSGGGGGNTQGGTSGTGGTTGGSPTGGKGGSSGTSGASSGTSGASGTNTGGNAGTGGAGGDGGGEGGEGGDGEGGMGPQGGTAGISMGGAGGAIAGGGAGGKAGGGAGGATAGGGVGGKAGGGAGGATAGGGAGGKAGGGAGGAVAGGGAGGAAAGTGGSGGVAATCDPNPPPEIYVGVLSGANERPTPVTTTATGFVVAELNAAATELTLTVRWSGLTTDVINGHIHGPAGVDGFASPIFHYFGDPPTLPPTPPPSTTGSVVAMTFPINATQLGYLRTGQLYANIHSVTNGSGEIRAQLVPATVFRSGTMSGAQEVPFVSSPATGRGVVAVFPDGIHASVSFTWSGLTSVKTNGHVHGPAPIGVGPVGVIFPLLPTAGATSGSLPHQIWTFAGADSANLLGNLTYANVHSMLFGAGEIRGQLLPPCPI